MSAYVISIPLRANGNIYPYSFIKLDPSNPDNGLQAGLGDIPIGITPQGTYNFPSSDGSGSPYAAIAGQNITAYAQGSVVELQAGTGGYVQGNYLKPDASGYGIVAGSGESYGAIALETATVGTRARVVVVNGRGGGLANIVAETISTTFLGSDTGKVVLVNGADTTQTLPSATDGLKFTFINTATGVTGSTGTLIAVNGTQRIMGNGITSASSKGILNTHATAKEGDSVTLVGTTQGGIVGWYITAITGTWAVQS